jgi:hypothetical protein
MAASTRFTSDNKKMGGRETMNTNFLTSAVAALCLAATSAVAREPGTPAAMPSGATVAVPIGANPPPGLYFSSRSEVFSGDLRDGNGDKLPVPVDINVTALQFHWVPGNEILGASYRAMVLLPLVDVTAAGTSSSGLGDITVSPVNLSWMVSPGVFVHSGLSFGLPTGNYKGLGQPNLGNNVVTTGLDFGFSYQRDGWNLSLQAYYFAYATNHENDFKSGDELLVNWTAMKGIANDQSLGLVGYYRKQLRSDTLGGAVFGTGNKAESFGIGLGYSKRFGPTELNLNILHDISAKNEIGGTKLQINLTTPIKF